MRVLSSGANCWHPTRMARSTKPQVPDVVRVTETNFHKAPAKWAAKANKAARLVVTDEAGKPLFVIVRQRTALKPGP